MAVKKVALKGKVAKAPAKKAIKKIVKKVAAKKTIHVTAPRARAKKSTEFTPIQAEAVLENLLGDNNEGGELGCGDGGDIFSNGEPTLPSDEHFDENRAELSADNIIDFCNEGGESTEQQIVMDADQTVNTTGDSIDGDEDDSVTAAETELAAELLGGTGDEDEDEDLDEEDEDGEGDEEEGDDLDGCNE